MEVKMARKAKKTYLYLVFNRFDAEGEEKEVLGAFSSRAYANSFIKETKKENAARDKEEGFEKDEGPSVDIDFFIEKVLFVR